MPFGRQSRSLSPGKHRLYERIRLFNISLASLVVAAHALKGNANPTLGTLAIELNQLELAVKMTIDGMVQAGLDDERKDIALEFITRHPGPPLKPGESVVAYGAQQSPPTFGLVTTIANLITPIFVEYYESYRGWMFKQHGHPDAGKWPEEWRFARVVRNAISHGGKTLIDAYKGQPVSVSWYGLTYKTGDQVPLLGIRNAPLAVGDLIVLLFETSDQLDVIGCTA